MWIQVLRNTLNNVRTIRLEENGQPVIDKLFGELKMSRWQPGVPNQPIVLEDIATLGTYVPPTSDTHVRLKQVDSTAQPGVYEMHLPNEWFAHDAPDSFLITITDLSTGAFYSAGLCELVEPVSVTMGPVTVLQTIGNVIGQGIPLSMFRKTKKQFALSWLDAEGNPVSHTGKNYRFIVGTNSNPPTPIFECEGSEITITGDQDEIILIDVSAAKSDADLPQGHWWLYDLDTTENPNHGEFQIHPALQSTT